MRIKKWMAMALCTAVCLQLLPASSLATSAGDALNKAPGYQDFPAYYSDSHYADHQGTHPKAEGGKYV